MLLETIYMLGLTYVNGKRIKEGMFFFSELKSMAKVFANMTYKFMAFR